MSAGNPDQKVYVYAVFSSLKNPTFRAPEEEHVCLTVLEKGCKKGPTNFFGGDLGANKQTGPQTGHFGSRKL